MSANSLPESLPVELTLDQCIKCNICVTKCPVAPVTDLFPGPKYEGPQAGRFRQPLGPSPDHSVDYCSGCRACNLACPTGVKIAEINARARARMVADGKFSLRTRLRNNLIARSELVGRLGQPISPIANALLGNRLLRKAIDAGLGIHHQAPLPAFARRRFTTWFKQHPRPLNVRRQVVYYHGCSTEYYEPRVGRAAVRVLEANGFEVLVPPQNCCGLPLLSNGEFSAARRYHQGNIDKLGQYVRQGLPIVGTSTSCTLTLKEEAPELLDFYTDEARLLAIQTFDFNEFILALHAAGELNPGLKPFPLSLPYHPPCQYRAHRLGLPALEVLSLIPQLTILDSKTSCCGVAGTYGYKTEKYQIGMDVGAPLFEFVNATGSRLVICDSETCRWQITHATGVPAVHPVEVLAYSYGFDPEGPLASFLSQSPQLAGNKSP